MSDAEAETPMEELVKAHRKEKKELQVKIIYSEITSWPTLQL